MQEYINLAIMAAFVMTYSAVARRLEKTMISGALVFIAFGFLFGPLGLDVLKLGINAHVLRTITEMTLALVLFTDAANANLAVLKKGIGLPQRLLLIGLPLTIALGFGVGALLFRDLALLEVGLLATMLAPTDAALGKAVVTNPIVPARVRETLNVESGLNDGICVPVLFTLLALAVGHEVTHRPMGLALHMIIKQISIGVFVGIGLALLAVYALRYCARRDWISEEWAPVPVAALAIACFAAAQALEGSGFIAAFVGGLVSGAMIRKSKHELLIEAERVGAVFSMITWVVFSVVVASRASEILNWRVILYAILSLTVIRMAPVALVLTGSGLSLAGKLFIGWFGPRGLASIVFIIIVLEEHLPGQQTLAAVVVCTVIFSVIAHGLTATPLAAWYSKVANQDGE